MSQNNDMDQNKPIYCEAALEFRCLAPDCKFKAICWCDGKAFCQIHGRIITNEPTINPDSS